MPDTFIVRCLLLVEDSDDDILITQRKLFKSHLKVNEFVVAKSVNDAKQILTNKPVDVVLLDLNMPETRGLDTLDEIRKVYSGVVVVVTSIDDELIGIQAIRHTADDYVVKNNLTEDLLTRSVIYARERRKLKEHMDAIQQKMELLTEGK